MKRLILCIALLCELGGCREPEVTTPPQLRLGRDECAHCGMLINDARYAAAAIIRKDGRARAVLFDDIGDLVDYLADHSAIVEKRFVSDYASKTWVSADSAHYVHVPDLHTPMGSGLLAFASPTQADGQSGKRLAFAELASHRAGE